jgi:hypothetical protein
MERQDNFWICLASVRLSRLQAMTLGLSFLIRKGELSSWIAPWASKRAAFKIHVFWRVKLNKRVIDFRRFERKYRFLIQQSTHRTVHSCRISESLRTKKEKNNPVAQHNNPEDLNPLVSSTLTFSLASRAICRSVPLFTNKCWSDH